MLQGIVGEERRTIPSNIKAQLVGLRSPRQGEKNVKSGRKMLSWLCSASGITYVVYDGIKGQKHT